ncbi:MAG TPA: TRAP transporter large permease subunit, partial [Caldithrix abyssi]|nr:TRAP transporter large permease subunit [Caldithrix abyssi]
YLIDAEVPMRILAHIQTVIHSRFGFLLLLNGFLLIIGAMMDIFSAIMVVVPLIIPIATHFGIDPVHLGIIFLVNLGIGYSTPPVGMNLFIASLRFKQPVMRLYVAALPFLVILLIALALVTFVPDLSLWLVHLYH